MNFISKKKSSKTWQVVFKKKGKFATGKFIYVAMMQIHIHHKKRRRQTLNTH
jgi:hypothetical protein